MIIGMRGHDFGRMEPRALALAIREAGFEATQLAFAKAFPAPAEQYMTPGALSEIRSAFAGIVLPVMAAMSAPAIAIPMCWRRQRRVSSVPCPPASSSARLRRHGDDPFHLSRIRA